LIGTNLRKKLLNPVLVSLLRDNTRKNCAALMIAQTRFVAYYRISTLPRKRSSPDLQTQRGAVKAYGKETLVAEFIEIEPECKPRWCELEKALATAQAHNAVLVIANLGRLTRSSRFLTRLLQAGIEVRFCDLPANQSRNCKSALKRLIATAEHQAQRTSIRTKAGLAAAKRRGVKVGGLRAGASLSSRARASGRAVRQERANAFAFTVGPVIENIRQDGTIALASIAKELIRQGVPSARGGRWTGTQVGHVRDRFLALNLSRAPDQGARWSRWSATDQIRKAEL
jgi:DNA invertase Pin-like site-specific DNA recombinase